MTDSASESELAYHLLLDPDEVEIAGRALHLLITDEAHEPQIRNLAREVLGLLEQPEMSVRGSEQGATLTVPLTPPQMKITHTAVKLLLDDTRRDQEAERRLLWSIIEKLPDEHSLRAITLP
jgi:hypothetical protein